MPLFGGSPKPASPQVPANDPDAVCYVTEQPPKDSGLPHKRTMTAEQEKTVAEIIEYLSDPSYALPTQLKDTKSYWKMQAKRAPDMSRLPSSHSRDGTDHSTASAATMHPEDPTLKPLSEREKCYLTTEQIQRCCRAVRWDLRKAVMRVEEILVWRRDYGVDEIGGADVEEESKTGKQYIFGFDKQSRPVHYMHPDRQNTKESPRQIQFVVYMLERTVDLMPAGVENLCLNIDFGSSHGGGQPTSIGQARQVLKILQTYYCERLGRAICIDVPTIFWAFFKMIQPFIDPVTKDKIRFVRNSSETLELVDADQLIKHGYGGNIPFAYKHADYYSNLEKICLHRRMKLFQNWKALGAKVGESEYAIKTYGQDASGERPKHAENEEKTARDPAFAEHGDVDHAEPPSSSASSIKGSSKDEDNAVRAGAGAAGAAGVAGVATGIEKTHLDADADPERESDTHPASHPLERKRTPARTEAMSEDVHPLVATLPAANNYDDPSQTVDTQSKPAAAGDKSDESKSPVAGTARPTLATAETAYADAPLASPSIVQRAVDQNEQEIAYKENMAQMNGQAVPAQSDVPTQSEQPEPISAVPDYLKRSVMQ